MSTRKPGQPSEQMQTDPTGTKSQSGLNREIQTKIGQQLRAMYDDVVHEGVPDRFAELLRRIDNPSDEGKAG